MINRSFQLPASLDTQVPTSPDAASDPTALTASATSKEAADVDSAKHDGDKIASCEDKVAANASNAGKAAAPSAKTKAFTPLPAVQAAIDRCLAVRDVSGSFISWGERSESAASASLVLVAQMKSDHNALKFVRQKLNEERKQRDERALNKSATNELLAVYMCAAPKTKAERQECSRFANVISVAVAEMRTSENIGVWLKKTTLTEALEKARTLKGKPANKNYSVAITRSKYPEIWTNFGTRGVREAIEKALTDLNKSLKKAPGHAR